MLKACLRPLHHCDPFNKMLPPVILKLSEPVFVF
jgi:hypothetical protein